MSFNPYRTELGEVLRLTLGHNAGYKPVTPASKSWVGRPATWLLSFASDSLSANGRKKHTAGFKQSRSMGALLHSLSADLHNGSEVSWTFLF